VSANRRTGFVLSMRLERAALFEIAQSFAVAVIALTALLLVEMVYEAVLNGLPLGSLLRFVPLMVPFSLPWTIPAAFVAACLMTYSRMAGSNELTVVRVSGVHIWRLLAPAALIAVVLCAVCGLLNHELVPQTRSFQYRIVKASAASEQIEALQAVDPLEPLMEIGDCKIWIGDLREDDTFRDITIVTSESIGPGDLDEAKRGRLVTYLRAPRGHFEHSDERAEIIFYLEWDPARVTPGDPYAGRAAMFKVVHGAGRYEFERAFFEHGIFPIELPSMADLKLRPQKGKHMTSAKLMLMIRQRRAEIERGDRRPPKPEGMTPGEYDHARKKYLKWRHEPRHWRTEIHKRAALSLAPFLLGAIAIPIGVLIRRGQRLVAFGLAVAIILSYYAVIGGAWNLGASGMLPPAVAVWGVTLCVAAGGLALMRIMFKR